MSQKGYIIGCADIAAIMTLVLACNHSRRIAPLALVYEQEGNEALSSLFLTASEKAKEAPGQTTPVVRAYVSVAVQELASTEPSSGNATNNTYQVMICVS